jgi:hypothetical protein
VNQKGEAACKGGISIPSFISIGQIMQYYTMLTGVLRNDAHTNKIARTHKNRQIYRSLWLLHFGEPLSCPRYPISKKPNPRTQLKQYRLALTGAQGLPSASPISCSFSLNGDGGMTTALQVSQTSIPQFVHSYAKLNGESFVFI